MLALFFGLFLSRSVLLSGKCRQCRMRGGSGGSRRGTRRRAGSAAEQWSECRVGLLPASRQYRPGPEYKMRSWCRLHWCELVLLAQVGTRRTVAPHWRVAGRAGHQVAHVLIPRQQPVRRGGGGCQDVRRAVGLLPRWGVSNNGNSVSLRRLRPVGFGDAACRLLNRRAGGRWLDKPQAFRYLVENAHVCFTSVFCRGDKGDRGDKPGLRGL